jgi:hypothetical protein
MTDLRLVDGIEVLDGLAASQQFLRLRGLYIQLAESSDEQPNAQDRGALIELARRLLDLIDPADLFVQTCQEQTQQVKGTPEFDERVKSLLASDKLSDAVRGELTGKDLVQEAEAGGAQMRELFADERTQLPKDLERLEAGGRPTRRKASDDISQDAALGAGVAFEIAGAAMVTAAVLAPKTAGASLVAGVAVGGLAVEAGGLLLIVAAVTS